MIAVAATAVAIGTLLLPVERCDIDGTPASPRWRRPTTRRRRPFRHPSIIIIALALSMLTACSNYDGDISDLQAQISRERKAVVTYVPIEGNSFRFILDGSSVIKAVNGLGRPMGDFERRCLISYTITGQRYEPDTLGGKTLYIEAMVYTVDSIFTKTPTPFDPDNSYLSHAIQVYDQWPTLIADGYLTVLVNRDCNLNGLRLVTGINPDDPLEMELTYDSRVIPQVTNPYNPVAAFDLSGVKGLADGQMLRLRWTGSDGPHVDSLQIHLRGGLPIGNGRDKPHDRHPVLSLNL